MEAHHFGAQLLDGGAGRIGEAVDGRKERKLGHLRAKLFIVWRKTLEPCRLARKVPLRLFMAEEIEVDRLLRARPDRGHAVADLIVAEPGAGERAESAGFRDGNRHVHAA